MALTMMRPSIRRSFCSYSHIWIFCRLCRNRKMRFCGSRGEEQGCQGRRSGQRGGSERAGPGPLPRHAAQHCGCGVLAARPARPQCASRCASRHGARALGKPAAAAGGTEGGGGGKQCWPLAAPCWCARCVPWAHATPCRRRRGLLHAARPPMSDALHAGCLPRPHTTHDGLGHNPLDFGRHGCWFTRSEPGLGWWGAVGASQDGGAGL